MTGFCAKRSQFVIDYKCLASRELTATHLYSLMDNEANFPDDGTGGGECEARGASPFATGQSGVARPDDDLRRIAPALWLFSDKTKPIPNRR
jgi:hypothetical protein